MLVLLFCNVCAKGLQKGLLVCLLALFVGAFLCHFTWLLLILENTATEPAQQSNLLCMIVKYYCILCLSLIVALLLSFVCEYQAERLVAYQHHKLMRASPGQ